MGGDPVRGVAGGFGVAAEQDGDRLAREWVVGEHAVRHGGEESARLVAAQLEPGAEGFDGVGGGVVAVGDGDGLSFVVLVGLGSVDGEDCSPGLELHVGQGEVHDLGASRRGGEAEQDDRGVADADRCRAVNVLNDLADGLLHAQPIGQVKVVVVSRGGDVHPVVGRGGQRRVPFHPARWARTAVDPTGVPRPGHNGSLTSSALVSVKGARKWHLVQIPK